MHTTASSHTYVHGVKDGQSRGWRAELPDQLCALKVPHLDHPIKAPSGQEPWREVVETEDILTVLASPLPATQRSGIKDLKKVNGRNKAELMHKGRGQSCIQVII